MPLKKSTSKKNISYNIKELYKDNEKYWKQKGNKWKKRSRKQIIAISMNVK